MAVIVNKNTVGTPITASSFGGSTQSIQVISAPRVYVKTTPDSLSAAPVATYNIKSNGGANVLPGGTWIDLGNIKGNLKVMYQQKVKDVKTGIDNVFRTAYIQEKIGSIEGEFEQFDDTVFAAISGLTPTVAGSLNGSSILNFQIGATDLNTLAVIFIVQNKLDGKEWQFYNPAALIQWEWAQSGDQMTMKMTGKLPFFASAATPLIQQMVSATIFP